MKERIYGYETEYALIISSEQDLRPTPRRMRIYEHLERLISSTVKVLPAVYRKKGIFMENGGLFNYEAVHSNFLEGLLEMATPECSNAREVALYHTAQTQLLYEMLKRLNRDIEEYEPGFKGKISIGKRNADFEGRCISSHENYLVEDVPDLPSKLKLFLIAPLFYVINLILMGLSYLPIIIHSLLIFAISFFTNILSGILSSIPDMSRYGEKLYEFVSTHLLSEEFLYNHLVRFQGSLSHLIYLPWVHLFSWLISPLVFRKFRSELVPFLVSRTIFTGSGKVDLIDTGCQGNNAHQKGAPFKLSQRASAIHSVSRIYFDDENRPMIDLRDILLDPLSALSEKKRLHVLVSDTNMSSIGVYLKCATTGLVIEMIEDGVTFPETHLTSPVEALKTVSGDISLKEKLPLENGSQASALEIQKYYLSKAREYYQEKYPSDTQVMDILDKWEYILSSLEINPHLLYKKVDWVTKKDLIEEVVRDRVTLGELAQLSHWFTYLEKRCMDLGIPGIPSRDELQSLIGEQRLAEFESFLFTMEMEAADFLERWKICQEILKVDFKYHELADEGYYYRLLKSDLVDEIFTESELSWARFTPPASTRAHIRGELIKQFGKKYTPLISEEYEPDNFFAKIKIGWNKFYTNWPWNRVTFNDPFDTDLDSMNLPD